MIMQAVYLVEPNPGLKSSESTQIYFDTPLVMWILDCAVLSY
jgi:hypothetical protein